MSAQPLPSRLADLTPGQRHSLNDYVQSVNERSNALRPGSGHTTPGQALRSAGFREAYNVITTTPDRHQRGTHKAGGKLATALEQFGYRPAYAEWDVGETPDAE